MMKLRYHADSSTFYDKDGKLFPNPAQTLEELETRRHEAIAKYKSIDTIALPSDNVNFSDFHSRIKANTLSSKYVYQSITLIIQIYKNYINLQNELLPIIQKIRCSIYRNGSINTLYINYSPTILGCVTRQTVCHSPKRCSSS